MTKLWLVVVFYYYYQPVLSPDTNSETSDATGCLFQSDLSKKKGDFVLQTGHVIEVVTKLFLVVQNAVGKAPEVNILTEWVTQIMFFFSLFHLDLLLCVCVFYLTRFEANFGGQIVTFTFKCMGGVPDGGGQRVLRRGNKMEVLVWRNVNKTYLSNQYRDLTAIVLFLKKKVYDFWYCWYCVTSLAPIIHKGADLKLTFKVCLFFLLLADSSLVS